jgi:hypothetical protein
MVGEVEMARDPQSDGRADEQRPSGTGNGSSIVGVDGALRARDVSRPRPADLRAAALLPVRRTGPRTDP